LVNRKLPRRRKLIKIFWGDRNREGDWEKFGMGGKLREGVLVIAPTNVSLCVTLEGEDYDS
jgi:hypothetical protein